MSNLEIFFKGSSVRVITSDVSAVLDLIEHLGHCELTLGGNLISGGLLITIIIMM